MTGRTRAVALAGLLLVAVIVIELPDAELPGRHRPETASPPSRLRPTPAPPRLDSRTINQQDRTNPAQRRREHRDAARRPLLAVLPINLAGVRIGVGGIGADGRTTTIAIDAGRRGRRYAAALFARALAAYGDSGAGYSVRWVR